MQTFKIIYTPKTGKQQTGEVKELGPTEALEIFLLEKGIDPEDGFKAITISNVNT